MASSGARSGRLPGGNWLLRERPWIFAFLALLTFCRIPTIDGWDEAFYVGQLTSLVGDGDLKLQDDVVRVPRRFEEEYRILTTVDGTGALVNTFGVGPALLLAPFTFAAIGASTPPPWTSFRCGAALGAMLALILIALLVTAAARGLGVSASVAFMATSLAMVGGPLAVYGTRSYLNAHLWSALLVALCLHQALAWLHGGKHLNALGIGLSAGLVCVTRWQDAVLVVPLVLTVLVVARPASRTLTGIGLMAGSMALAVSIQLLAWQIQFGTPLLVPQGAGYMRWLAPRIVPLLLSSYHGLVPWAPGLALGLLGLLLGLGPGVPRPPRALVCAMAVGTACALYVSACPVDWWGRESFGPRRLASLTPFAAVGLGFVLERLPQRTRLLLFALLGLWATVTVSAFFSGWDDLSVLLLGRTDPFNPNGIESYAGAAWINRWGALHFLKPAFSLSDAPQPGDRLLGILVALGVTLVGRGLWRLLSTRVAAQRAVAALAVAYLIGWNVLLLKAPSNRQWNADWKRFLQAPLEPASTSRMPPEMAQACAVVVAPAAASRGERAVLAGAISVLRNGGMAASEAAALRAAREYERPR